MPITMSDLETAVYAWLSRYSVLFDFQSQVIGGYGRQLGDAIADFVLIESNTILRVQGSYWHSGISKRASDEVQKLRLQGLGYSVVDLWEEDIRTRLDTMMKAAIEGRGLR